eukprot:TRINITY_DN21922_c0_g1_i2.p1 TRINITY_DN21922_c0_g1~~TRINITY_DN21922_c0_g1_i2.p1  ORF type:complete len:800 (-),score=167.05 TRINITY_DN21922_c0_g1_i2:80-2479(-)
MEPSRTIPISRFKTRSAMIASGKTPSRRRKPASSSEKKWAPLESITMNELLWICDQTFVKTANHLTEHLSVRLVHEINHAVETLRQEITPMEQEIKRVHSGLDQLRADIEPTVKDCLTEVVIPEHQKSASQISAFQATYQDHMASLQDAFKVSQASVERKIESVPAEVKDIVSAALGDVKEQVTKVHDAVKESNSRESVLLEAISGENQLREVHFEAEMEKSRSAIRQGLEAATAEVSKLARQLESDSQKTQNGFQLVCGGVDDLQRCLKEDLSEKMDLQTDVLKKCMQGGMGGSKSSARLAADCDENGVQTDPPSVSDAWLQTGDELMKKKKTKRPPLFQHTKTSMTFKEKESETKKAKNRLRDFSEPVFASEVQMKQQVRDQMIKKPYNVTDYYRRDGWASRIASHRRFELATFLMVVANGIWIAVDVDLNKATILTDADPIFQIAENFFCLFFTCELVIRFAAFERKINAFKDIWMMFDLILVVLMMVETWILPVAILLTDVNAANIFDPSALRILRSVKMVRLSRMARLMRHFPELVIVIRAIGAATRSIVVIGVFVVLIVYVFAVILRQATDGQDTGRIQFQSVPHAMNSLLLDGILPDQSYLVNDLAGVSYFLWPVVVVFILLTVVTLMYMLIGVMVNVIAMVAAAEREGMAVSYLAGSLRKALNDIGYEAHHTFTKDEFKELVIVPEIVRILSYIDVDVIILVEVADSIYEDFVEREGHGFGFTDLVEVFLSLRGGNPATVKDIKGTLRSVKQAFTSQVEGMVARLEKELRLVKQGTTDLQDSGEDDEDAAE